MVKSAVLPPPPTAEPNYAQEKLREEIREKFAFLVGAENVTDKLIDLYWRANHVMSRQGGGQLGSADLAVLCALSGCVKLPGE